MKINESYIVTIDDMSVSGEGIGRADGMAVFVPGLVPGDTAEIEIVNIKKNMAHGRISVLKEASPSRVKPECVYFECCGGCQLQNMSYEAQILMKQKQLIRMTRQLCRDDMPLIDEPAAMEEPWHYRNKVEFNVEGEKAGFYRRRTNEIIECGDGCPIQSEAAAASYGALKAYLKIVNTHNMDNDRTDPIRRMIVRNSRSGDVMIILVSYSADLPEIGTFIRMAEDSLKKLSDNGDRIFRLRSVVLDINNDKKIIGPGRHQKVIYGSDILTDEIGGIKFEISPYSFYQINTRAAEKIYETALRYAGLTGNETVYDLYCGVGTVGLFMAGYAKYVCGIEILNSAVVNARRNAVINGISNINFIEGRAEEKIGALIERNSILKKNGKPDVITVDPPRAGLKRELIEAVIELSPDRIVYISCDQGTLMRDIRLLSGAYRMERCRIVDQFCQTRHVETVCLLSNRKRKPDSYVKVSLDNGNVLPVFVCRSA